MESWAGCVASALKEETYWDLLREAGFTDIEVKVIRRYSLSGIARKLPWDFSYSYLL